MYIAYSRIKFFIVFLKYSIVIPVFKRKDILKRCLKSISKQILKPLEVIIVDNNTKKFESKILQDLLSKSCYQDLNMKY